MKNPEFQHIAENFFLKDGHRPFMLIIPAPTEQG